MKNGGIILFILILISIYLIFKYYRSNLKEGLNNADPNLVDFSGLDKGLMNQSLGGPTLPLDYYPAPKDPGCWYMYPTGCDADTGYKIAKSWTEDTIGYTNAQPPSNSSKAACTNRQESLREYCNKQDVLTYYVPSKITDDIDLNGDWKVHMGGDDDDDDTNNTVEIQRFGSAINTTDFGLFGTGTGSIANNLIEIQFSSQPNKSFYGNVVKSMAIGTKANLQINWYTEPALDDLANAIGYWTKEIITDQTPCTWLPWQLNTNYPGNDMHEGGLPGMSLDQCKDMCKTKQPDGCAGIVYDNNSNKCWLKTEISGVGQSENDVQAYSLSQGCPQASPVDPPAPPNPPETPPCPTCISTPTGVEGEWTQAGIDGTATLTDKGPCPPGVGVGCPDGAIAVEGSGTDGFGSVLPGNGFVNGDTLTFRFSNNTILTASFTTNKITWSNGVIWTRASAAPAPAPAPAPAAPAVTAQQNAANEAIQAWKATVNAPAQYKASSNVLLAQGNPAWTIAENNYNNAVNIEKVKAIEMCNLCAVEGVVCQDADAVNRCQQIAHEAQVAKEADAAAAAKAAHDASPQGKAEKAIEAWKATVNAPAQYKANSNMLLAQGNPAWTIAENNYNNAVNIEKAKATEMCNLCGVEGVVCQDADATNRCQQIAQEAQAAKAAEEAAAAKAAHDASPQGKAEKAIEAWKATVNAPAQYKASSNVLLAQGNSAWTIAENNYNNAVNIEKVKATEMCNLCGVEGVVCQDTNATNRCQQIVQEAQAAKEAEEAAAKAAKEAAAKAAHASSAQGQAEKAAIDAWNSAKATTAQYQANSNILLAQGNVAWVIAQNNANVSKNIENVKFNEMCQVCGLEGAMCDIGNVCQ